MKLFYLLSITICLSCLADSSHAAYTLDFSVGGSIGEVDATVVPGDVFNFEIYLTETDPDGGLTAIGLREFRFFATVSDPGFANATNALRASTFEAHNGFESDTSVVDSNTLRFGGLASQTDQSVGVFPVDDGVADRSILLASGQFTLASDATGSTTITLSPNGVLAPFSLADQNSLPFDDAIAVSSTPFTLNASAVPEPCSVSLLAAGCLMAIGYTRRQKTSGRLI